MPLSSASKSGKKPTATAAEKAIEKILDTSNLPGMNELCDGLEARF
jgi:hypothetical protein